MKTWREDICFFPENKWEGNKKLHLSFVNIHQVVAKPKGVHTASDKPRSYSKMSKLPPRFARQREQQRGDKGKGRGSNAEESDQANIMSRIENWDNELANNIPPLMSDVINTDLKQQEMDITKSRLFTPCHWKKKQHISKPNEHVTDVSSSLVK